MRTEEEKRIFLAEEEKKIRLQLDGILSHKEVERVFLEHFKQIYLTDNDSTDQLYKIVLLFSLFCKNIDMSTLSKALEDYV